MRDPPVVESPVAQGDVLAQKYKVDRIIGVGGMGVVVAATHLALNQKVALKLLLPSALSSAESVERFLREARAIASLRSVHVPRVVDVGTLESGQPYMVMELLEGEDLGQLLARCGPLGSGEAMEYVRQACEALVEAHDLGIVHRDLKPNNLFLARDARGREQIKLLDFGISKSRDLDAGNLSLTRTSAVMGSPVYMSPEQMRASRDVDARTDIWSLGVTLYELVTGELPFHAESAMALGAKVLHEAPAPPSERRPDIPPPLNALILRCLEKDPANRFPDARTLMTALSEGGASTDTPARRAPPTHPRVTLGAGGTPPTGSRTLPFSDTQAAVAAAPARWTATGAAAAISVIVAGGITIALVRPRPGASPSDPRAPLSISALPAAAEHGPTASDSSADGAAASASASPTTKPAPPPTRRTGPTPRPRNATTVAAPPPPAPSPSPSPPTPANPLDHL
jgi:serine/threonine protein kinase